MNKNKGQRHVAIKPKVSTRWIFMEKVADSSVLFWEWVMLLSSESGLGRDADFS